jgi:hypothetical protein
MEDTTGIQGSIEDDNIAEFLINDVYPDDVIPISCVLTGSRAYGLGTEDSDRDYVGLHLMNTWECLEHPSFRRPLQVIRKRYSKDLEEILPDKPEDGVSLVSFEVWKFISMLLKGSPVVYEILYMPETHSSPEAAKWLELMRCGLTNRLGRAARGIAIHDWGKRRSSRKKAVMAYYRLIQATCFLREEEFEWQAEALWEYARPAGLVEMGTETLNAYLNPASRNTPLSDEDIARTAVEIENLINEVERAMVVTRLPDQCPKKVLEDIRRTVINSRSAMI